MSFPAPMRVDKSVFGEDGLGALLQYIEDNVEYLKAKCRGIRETKMPEWVRIYRGIPAEKEKTWPWPGASNLVIQIAGSHCDELLSRVMAMYQTDPLFNVKLLGDFNNQGAESGDEQREIFEYFLQDCAYEPTELDLYRVEETGFSSAIRYGTGIFKFPWEYIVEEQPIYLGGGTVPGTDAKHEFRSIVKRDGPHPENVPLNDWSIDPRFPNLNLAPFKIHTLHLNGYELENKKFDQSAMWDHAAIDKVLLQPDKIPEYRRQLEEQKDMETMADSQAGDNYDIEECWFTYKKDGKTFRLISNYHEATRTHLGIIFNPYPDNEEPFEDAKLAYDDDTYFGYGLCEMLESYQREVTNTHNWRADNRHFKTTGALRVNKNSKLSSILQVYPGVMIPADQEEVEALQLGSAQADYGTEDESLTLQLATIRTGIDPAEGGSGAGIVNPKKGTYSAQGTAITNQSRNNRNSLRMSDMRSCHVRVGRKVAKMYAYFGLGDKIRKYGDRAQILQKALDNYKAKRLGLVIKPATASQNREVEKQNDILLTATLERLYAGDLQLMQALSQPGINPMLQDLMVRQLKAKNQLMKSLLRAFGKDNAEQLLAVPQQLFEEHRNAANGNARNTQSFASQAQSAQGMVPGGTGQMGGDVPVQ